MTTHFEAELAHLKEKLLTMGSYAESAVNRAVKAVTERDDDLARHVKEDDTVLDQLEIEIDDIAIHLLSKAPLATDLRFITVAMKISHDLERVGDEATTIARRAMQLNQDAELTADIDIPGLSATALEMLKGALDAFVQRAAENARRIVPRDKAVDEWNRQIHRTLLARMTDDPLNIPRALNLMVISKSLERVADHATNIAEEVVYLYEAQDIRHTAKTAAAARHGS